MIRRRDLHTLDDLLRASAELERAFGPSDTPTPRREREAPESATPVSLYEDEAGYELVAALPGVAAQTLDVRLEGDVLTISGERLLPEPEGGKCLRRERRRGPFAREVRLPAAIDGERVESCFTDGLLRVLLPKARRESASETTRRRVVPAFDVYEDAAGVTLIGDLPGCAPDSLEIEVDEATLTIEGHASFEAPSGSVERLGESEPVVYARSFELRPDLDRSRISASLRDGVLTLVVPKIS